MIHGRAGSERRAGDLCVTIEPLPSLLEVERDWRDLEGRSDRSFFISWSWIGAWLTALPAHIRPELLRVQSQGRTVAMGVLVRRRLWRHGVFLSRALFLNCTGDPDLDSLTIEYNGLLVERGFAQEAGQSCIDFLLSRDDWDEWFLRWAAGPRAIWPRARQRRPLGGAPPEHVPPRGSRSAAGFGGRLSRASGSNTRHNIRRSMREYERFGSLVLESATTPEQAEAFLSGLMQLHQAYWQGKGLAGAFANPFFVEFHTRLVRSRFGDGAIQLLALRAGNQIVGYLYNFVDRGRVYNYQSGYDYDLCANHLAVPVWWHMRLAVEFNRGQGHLRYEFMAGDSQYKQALGVGSTEMIWLVAQRTRLRFLLEGGLRWVRAWTRSEIRRRNPS